MSKSFKNLDDLSQDIRDNVLGVIAANNIDFDFLVSGEYKWSACI